VGLLLLAAMMSSQCSGGEEVIDTVAVPIAQAVQKLEVAENHYARKVLLKTRVFYRATNYERTWLDKRRPSKKLQAFADEVRESARYGFIPEDYHLEELVQEVDSLYDNRKRTDEELSDLDIRITASFFLFTTHLIDGRIRHPGGRDFLWKRGMPLENDIAILKELNSEGDLRKELKRLHPDDVQYERLQKALVQYIDIAKGDTLPNLPPVLTVKPGEQHEQIPLVRRRLNIAKPSKKSDSSTLYDDDLVLAIKTFQDRHGLVADGIIRGETVRFLNQPLSEKADILKINLERLRWRPHLDKKKEQIIVNVPEYMLRLYKDEKEKLNMRVILGAEFTPTPVFHDTITQIVFSPTWAVPASIFKKEFLPVLADDPSRFDRERFRFYKNGKEIDPTDEKWNDDELDTSAYRVIENPGERNSLGRVKFIMPNDYSIYLHDTPAGQLFGREARALSHGCIRVEKPLELALYLLSDSKEWDRERIRKAMESGEPKPVKLKEPIPVHIVYRTAWVDDDGNVHFRNDIYGHDKRQLARLKKNTLQTALAR